MKRLGRVLMCGLVASFVLSGCSSLKLEDVAGPATAATVAAGTAVLTVNPVVGIAAGTAAGAAVEAAIPEPATVDITQVTNEHQAEVAKKQLLWETIQSFWQWALGAGVALIVAAWIIPGPQTLFRKKPQEPSNRREGMRSTPRYRKGPQ